MVHFWNNLHVRSIVLGFVVIFLVMGYVAVIGTENNWNVFYIIDLILCLKLEL